MTKSLIDSGQRISNADSIYRNVQGGLTWSAANYLYQNTSLAQYLDSGVSAITDGFEKGGKFFAYVAGQLVELAFLPSETSPYLYSSASISPNYPHFSRNDGFDSAISQCKAAYLVYDNFRSDYYCGSTVEGAAQEFFNSTYGHHVFACDNAAFYSVDVSQRRVWYRCFHSDDSFTSDSVRFLFSATGYQPPPSPDPSGDTPISLPNKPLDVIKPSLDKPVPIADVAAMLNAIAQDAASSDDYQGVPFSPSSPITEQEVNQAIAGNGTTSLPTLSNPTVKDILAPAQSGGASSSISADIPTSAAIPSDTSTTGDNIQDKPDYSFPATPAPYLETPPDGDTILKPLTSLLPFLKDFQFHTKQTECPIFSFDFVGTKIVIDEHCNFLAKYGVLIKSVCTAFWLFSALRIILSA